MTNWTKIFETLGQDTLTAFAKGSVSWNSLEKKARFTDVSGDIRSLLRGDGVERARKLTRRALSRRGVNV